MKDIINALKDIAVLVCMYVFGVSFAGITIGLIGLIATGVFMRFFGT